MTKTKKIVLLVTAIIILSLLMVAKLTGGANGTVTCPDCTEGKVVCSTCVDFDEEEQKVCEDCDGTLLVTCETCEGEAEVRATLWAILPPIIAIGLALITKEVFSSLFIGMLSGAILYADFSFTGSFDALINDGLISAVSGTAGIFIFLIILGIIVSLINKAGGSQAFGKWAQTHVKTRVGSMFATFFLGVLIFVDDYFNCLTVGSVMRPVADNQKISRAKLSYIIDATAAPVCMIAPISSWAAAVASYVEPGQSPFALFINAIPYNFYSILTLVFVISIVLMKFDYGPMRLHEYNAMTNGDLYTSGEKNEVADDLPSAKGKVIDLVIPIAILIVSCILGLLYVGGLLDGASIMVAFSETDATVGLPLGSLIALIIILVYMLFRKVFTFKEAMECIPKGFVAMVPAILILTFATALKNMTTGLGAKYYVGDLMMGNASTLGKLLPAIIFLVACVLSFATGTSWGTFGILIPIVTAIFEPGSELLIIGMSACLAGAVCGDHCSPISDTTIMSSAGAECEHLNHVSTQLPYTIFVAVQRLRYPNRLQIRTLP